MNRLPMTIALTAGRSAFKQVKKFREKNSVNLYDALLDASRTAEDATEGTSDQLHSLAEQARKRLEKAKSEAQQKAADATQSVRKRAREQGKAAEKQAKLAEKQARKRFGKKAKQLKQAKKKDKKRGGCLKRFGFVSLLLAALGGLAYWLTQLRHASPTASTPPRTQEFTGKRGATESTLVYSTTTDTPADAAAAEQAAADQAAEAGKHALKEEPLEGAPERDEELLQALDEQIAKHRLDEEGEQGPKV